MSLPTLACQEFLAALGMYSSHLDFVLAALDKLETDIKAEYERIQGNFNPEYHDQGDVLYQAERNVLGRDTLFDPPFQSVAAIAGYCILINHLFERFLEEIARLKAAYAETENFTLKTFLKYFQQFRSLPSYEKLNELRLVANYCKHGRGDSEKALRKQRPDYFTMSDHELWEPRPIFDSTTLRPLSGHDINIKRIDFGEYVKAMELFVTDVYGQLS